MESSGCFDSIGGFGYVHVLLYTAKGGFAVWQILCNATRFGSIEVLWRATNVAVKRSEREPAQRAEESVVSYW